MSDDRRKRASFQADLGKDRQPPHSLEAEQGVLGCILLAPNECLGQCIEIFGSSPDVFYDLRHQTIYETLITLSENRSPIDIVTVQQHLRDRGVLEQIGGIPYLNQLQDGVPSAANLIYYTDILEEKFDLRKTLNVCVETIDFTHNHSCSTAEFLDIFEKKALGVRVCKKQNNDIKELISQATDDLEKRMASDSILGISTELPDLDSATDGLHGGEVVVIAAYPSTGKTALACNIAFNAAARGIPVGFFSAEMLPRKIVSRGIFSMARVNHRKITELDFPKITSATAKIAKSPMFVEAASGMSISQIAAAARRMKQKHNIKVVVLDYLQLISGIGDNREQEVANVSRGIKSIAMELDCCVIALSQLNDDGKLRESRAIGQDADSVWKLLNNGEWQPKIQPTKLHVEKSRDGETGVVDLVFMKEYTRFESVSKVLE